MPNEQTSVPLFTSGEVLTAANMNLSAGTGVPVFTNTTTRDAGFGGAGEKVLAEGQLCYLSSTNVVQYYDGAAWATVGPATASALVRVGGGTLSGTSTAFTSVFSSTYQAYSLVFTDCATSGNADIFMILGATTTGYYGAAPGAIYATNAYSASIGAQNNAAAWFVNYANITSAGFTTELWNPNLAKKTFYRSGMINLNTVSGTSSGFLDNTTQYTGFTISASTGNLTGTCNIYGYSLS